MDPDRIVNTSTACLFTFKAMFRALPGVNFTGAVVEVTVIFGFSFHMGMMTLADAFTCQKPIRVIRSYSGLQRINRDERLSYLLAVAGGFFWSFLGALFTLFALLNAYSSNKKFRHCLCGCE